MAESILIKNAKMRTIRHLLSLEKVLANPVVGLRRMTNFQIACYASVVQLA